MNTSPTDREGFAAFLLRMRAEGLDDRLLMTAFESVPRRAFLRPEFHNNSWAQGVIPIDCGEVIENPDNQARCISALGVGEDHKVLEIGTGSGFTATVLSKLAKRVYTIERYRTLYLAASERFKELKVSNAIAVHGDGSKGATDGPFDRIIVWAAFDTPPRHFIEHLVSGGIMVCAIGQADEPQKLVRLTKVGSRYEREELGLVRLQLLDSKLPEIL